MDFQQLALWSNKTLLEAPKPSVSKRDGSFFNLALVPWGLSSQECRRDFSARFHSIKEFIYSSVVIYKFEKRQY